MKRKATFALLAAVILAACATGASDPVAVAARECGNFACVEGTRLIGVDAVEPASGGESGYRVRMRVEDGLSRRISAECMYTAANNTVRWAVPLPAGFVRL